MNDSGPAGNTYDKFNTSNPAARKLMEGFMTAFHDLMGRTQGASSVLEVGCGEGYMQQALTRYRFAERLAFDIDAPIVTEARRIAPESHYLVADGQSLPFPDARFDVVMATEVLEHVSDPARVVAEMRRVSRRYVLVSVPREPLWRGLNLLRGKYVSAWGNTPGHVNHWSAGGFVRLVGTSLTVLDVRHPLPWTMVLAER
jgi:2-polyprenyl-3-methyl-5-hydroxy-6-metoxy-1,4-benzoquinol methylase